MELRHLLILTSVLCRAELDARPWTAAIPNTLVALRGSCVVIPCKYEYLCDDKETTTWNAVWRRTQHDTVVYHSDPSKRGTGEFERRTHLLGDLKQGLCDLKMDNLTVGDSGLYGFRIQGEKCSYNFNKDTVTLVVRDKPERPVITLNERSRVGDVVTACCSISFTCQSILPTLTWSRDGAVNQSEPEEESQGQWKMTSRLTFDTSDSGLNTQLTCTAEFKGHEKERVTVTLNLESPPKVKPESGCSAKHPLLTCHCVVESNPPSLVEWILPQQASSHGHVSRTRNGTVTTATLQADTGVVGAVSCHASNHHGNSTITLYPEKGDTTLRIIYIAVPVASALVIAMVAVAMWTCRRTKKCKISATIKTEDNPLYTGGRSKTKGHGRRGFSGQEDNSYVEMLEEEPKGPDCKNYHHDRSTCANHMSREKLSHESGDCKDTAPPDEIYNNDVEETDVAAAADAQAVYGNCMEEDIYANGTFDWEP